MHYEYGENLLHCIQHLIILLFLRPIASSFGRVQFRRECCKLKSTSYGNAFSEQLQCKTYTKSVHKQIITICVHVDSNCGAIPRVKLFSLVYCWMNECMYFDWTIVVISQLIVMHKLKWHRLQFYCCMVHAAWKRCTRSKWEKSTSMEPVP